jgi:hypothetical protein
VASSQIPVTLTVLSATQLTASPSNLTFNYVSGSATPQSQFISVLSTGAPITFNAIVSGPSWVTLSTQQATTPTAVFVSVNPPVGTAAGTYNASVLLSPVGGGKSTTVAVSVHVTAANYLSVNPSNITFDYTLGGPNPAPALVSVTTSSGSRLWCKTPGRGEGGWIFLSSVRDVIKRRAPHSTVPTWLLSHA